ncbi:MAG: urease accessory protein UreD [Burkholderiales bacterium]|nr:urease accessory protein UreD [Burkholderiales bacterium]
MLKPLYPEGDAFCHAVLVHPPGGIVEGDSLSVSVAVDAGANAVITTPGAQKWYRSAGRVAVADTQIAVANGASLEWMPQEAMAYDGARARQRLTIDLAPTARFFGWEVLCLGRTARGERFAAGEFQQRIRLVRTGKSAPLWSESMHLIGNDPLMSSPLGLRGLPVMATAWIALGGEAAGDNATAALATVREVLAEEPLAAASAPEEQLIVVKMIGDAPEAVRNLLIRVWKNTRLQLFEREPVLPRIWST